MNGPLYEPLTVATPTELRDSDKMEAERFFSDFMATRAAIAQILTAHLQELGVHTGNDGWLDAVGDWYFGSMSQARDAGDYDYREWVGVALDVSALAGDRLIGDHSHLSWELFRKTKRFALHNQPVIMGFRAAASGYAVGFWERLATIRRGTTVRRLDPRESCRSEYSIQWLPPGS